MEDRNEDGRTVVFMVAVAGGIALLLLVFLLPWPKSLADWQGAKAPVEVFSNIVGPLGALAAFAALVLNGRAANSTLRQSIRAERASRFQKAAELLSSHKAPSVAAATDLLFGLASEDTLYWKPTISALQSYIDDADKEKKDAARALSAPKAMWPTATFGSLDSLEALSRLYSIDLAWKTKTSTVVIPAIYLAGLSVIDLTLPKTRWTQILANRTHFVEVDFTGSKIAFYVGADVSFTRCVLSRCSITTMDEAGNSVAHKANRLTFDNCFVDGMTIDGRTLPDWETA